MISDRYVGESYDDDDLAELEIDIGAGHADVYRCERCDNAFAVRCWPASDHAALAAFQRGLVALEDCLGVAAYAIWTDDADRTLRPTRRCRASSGAATTSSRPERSTR